MASENPANIDGATPAPPGLRFSLQFLLAACLCAGLLARWPGALAGFGRDLTVANTKALGALLGLSMGGSGDIISVNGFEMMIIFECTALHYVLILCLAILLYTGHSIGYRLFGAALATLLVLAANALRLLVTGLIGSASLEAFRFVHEYLWVALFALLVFGIWKVWADGRLRLSGCQARQAGVVLLACSAAFLVLYACKEAQCRLLAALASPLLRLFLADAQASVVWNGHLQFNQGGVTAQAGNFFEIANFAVYLGLVVPKLRQGWRMACAALFGMVLLLAVYAEFIAFLGVHSLKQSGYAALYQGTGSGVLLAVPIALYWMVSRIGRRGAN